MEQQEDSNTETESDVDIKVDPKNEVDHKLQLGVGVISKLMSRKKT